MSTIGISHETQVQVPATGSVDVKLEVVIVPVADVDRAKRFYKSLGWRETSTSPAPRATGRCT